MPQSRKRQTGKRRRGGGVARSASSSQPSAHRGTSQSTRLISIILIVVLAGAGIAYLFMRGGGGQGGKEITTPSGLKYVDLVEGTGASPQKGQTVTVNYTGTLENGTKFDSSYDHGQPFQFPIGRGRVIRGWDEGLMTMKVGGKRKLIVPSQLGYGPAGNPPKIPGNSTLIFEVELLDVK